MAGKIGKFNGEKTKNIVFDKEEKHSRYSRKILYLFLQASATRLKLKCKELEIIWI